MISGHPLSKHHAHERSRKSPLREVPRMVAPGRHRGHHGSRAVGIVRRGVRRFAQGGPQGEGRRDHRGGGIGQGRERHLLAGQRRGHRGERRSGEQCGPGEHGCLRRRLDVQAEGRRRRRVEGPDGCGGLLGADWPVYRLSSRAKSRDLKLPSGSRDADRWTQRSRNPQELDADNPTIPLACGGGLRQNVRPSMRLILPALCALVVFATTVPAQAPADAKAQTRLLRFPAIHGTQIVFTYAGNLYTVAAGRRHRAPADQPRRLRDVRPLLARRQADRLHRRSTTATPRST